MSLPIEARWAILIFGLAGFGAAIYEMLDQPVPLNGRIFLWLAIAAVSARVKIRLFKGSSLSFLTCVVLLAVIQESPAVALLSGLCGVTVQTVFPSKKIVLHQLAFNASMIAVTVNASWLTYHALARAHAPHLISPTMFATMSASMIYFLGNSVSVSLILALTNGISVFQIWFHHFLSAGPSFLIAGLLSLALSAIMGASSLFIKASLLVISIAYYYSVRFTAKATT